MPPDSATANNTLRKTQWTPERDAALHDLRNRGLSFTKIAAILGIGRNTVFDRARAAPQPTALPPAPQSPPRPIYPEFDPYRDPLPPGHVESWGAITSGTLLDSTPYIRVREPRACNIS